MKKIFMGKVQFICLIMATFASYSTLAGIQGPPEPIPEPSMLPLFALAGVALYIIKKRKK